jgi:hypothetical protein
MSDPTPFPSVSPAADPRQASRPLRPVMFCRECGQAFTSIARQRYCSNPCNLRAFRRFQEPTRTAQRAAA